MLEVESERVRVVVVAGARPNFMKIAPLLREMRSRNRFDVILVHTGQHYDVAMSDSFFADLGIPAPDVNLGVGSGSHGEQTAAVLRGIEAILIREHPDALLVVGDVNSTIAAALAAAKLGIPVAHVEAGLRSFDRSMPEEINRVLTDQISDWLFTTEADAETNLLQEGIARGRIHFAGNVMIDTLQANLVRARQQETLVRLGLTSRSYALLTLHRPSNVDDPERLGALFAVLEEIHNEIPIIFPVHPRTKAAIATSLGGHAPKLRMMDPVGYLEFLELMSESRFVMTDSGGIQEETTSLGVPCLTLRDNTERPVTVSQGTNLLVGSDPQRIRSAALELLRGEGKARAGACSVPTGWDGHAARRIVDVLERDLLRRPSVASASAALAARE
jgi:UDP-N-acetylglucosamine 2-epimerase (non-hydrolysing)